MGDLETARGKLETMLEALSAIPELTMDEALARMSEMVKLAGDSAPKLEEDGQFEEAAAIYEIVARAFETAAQKVSEEDRQRMISLVDYWSLKANTVRLIVESEAEVTPPSPPYAVPPRAPAVDRISLKIQREGLVPAWDESQSSTVVSPQEVADPLKLGEEPTGREAKVRAPTPTDWEVKPEGKVHRFSHKKPSPR